MSIAFFRPYVMNCLLSPDGLSMISILMSSESSPNLDSLRRDCSRLGSSSSLLLSAMNWKSLKNVSLSLRKRFAARIWAMPRSVLRSNFSWRNVMTAGLNGSTSFCALILSFLVFLVLMEWHLCLISSIEGSWNG